jgi:hypothetical protein
MDFVKLPYLNIKIINKKYLRCFLIVNAFLTIDIQIKFNLEFRFKNDYLLEVICAIEFKIRINSISQIRFMFSIQYLKLAKNILIVSSNFCNLFSQLLNKVSNQFNKLIARRKKRVNRVYVAFI